MAVPRQMDWSSFARLITSVKPWSSIRDRAWPSVKLLAPATGAPAGTGVVLVATADGAVEVVVVVTGGGTGIGADVAAGLGMAVIGGFDAIGGATASATGGFTAGDWPGGLAGVVCATATPMEAEARAARVP